MTRVLLKDILMSCFNVSDALSSSFHHPVLKWLEKLEALAAGGCMQQEQPAHKYLGIHCRETWEEREPYTKLRLGSGPHEVLGP